VAGSEPFRMDGTVLDWSGRIWQGLDHLERNRLGGPLLWGRDYFGGAELMLVGSMIFLDGWD